MTIDEEMKTFLRIRAELAERSPDLSDELLDEAAWIMVENLCR